MIVKNVEVKATDNGAHLIAMLVQLASQFKSKINIKKDDKMVNAKSIMGMMAIGLTPGQSIEVNIDGKWVKTKLVPSVQTLTKQITVTNSDSKRTVIVDDVNTIYSVKLITVDRKTPSEKGLYIANLFINGNVFIYGLIDTQGNIGTYSYTQVIEIEYK